MDSKEINPPEAKKQKLCEPNLTQNVSPEAATKPLPEQVIKDEDTGPEAEVKSDSKTVPFFMEQVNEKSVGITEYISKHDGFSAVIKQRFSDFLVNEISEDGTVVELTSTDLPPTLPDTTQEGKDVRETIGDENAQKLAELLKDRIQTNFVLIQVGDDKDERSRIHRAVKLGYPGLDSSTVERDGKKYIEVRITNNQGNGLRNWPKGRGNYCKFVLYKENKDTMSTIGLIAKMLRVKSGLFAYAGTKDKRAKTSQEVTVFKMAAEKLLKTNKQLRNIVMGNFRYVKECMKLGQLSGNKFTIILRSVTGSANQIDEGMTSLKNVGFINYYGTQRFGTNSIPTHHIGIALLLSNWKEAIELILKPRSGDEQTTDEARKFWWETRNSEETIKKMPRHCHIERTVLYSLSENGENNYMAAMNKLARNTRLMYVHSYQSYIWNTVTSLRIQQHGLQPMLGDLVIPRDTVTSHTDINSMVDEIAEENPSKKPQPVCVDEKNIGSYTIYDVVLPLPGYDVVYPDNLKVEYEDLMKKDGLDCHSMRHNTKDYSLSGDYRHILTKPQDVTWSMHKYNDVTCSLALSDWDRFRVGNAEEPQGVEDGEHVALKMAFSLPTSAYATMALREVLKTDTSAAHQSTLNVT